MGREETFNDDSLCTFKNAETPFIPQLQEGTPSYPQVPFHSKNQFFFEEIRKLHQVILGILCQFIESTAQARCLRPLPL